jgi:GDP-L-fucose synthase
MEINRDDTILVTGGKGFLGHFVCKTLAVKGYTNVIPLKGTRKGIDLTNALMAKEVFRQYQPDVVLHLAARVGGIGANKDNPGKFFYDNMYMGMNVIEMARRFSVKKLVLTSTVCSYPKFTKVPFKEEDIWNGYPEETNAPYGVAKKALMEMSQAYHKQYGLMGVTLVPVNMYGPRDNFDPQSSHVIPALILKVQEAIDNGDSEIVAWGTGEASREFLYVEDCAEGIVSAMESYDSPEPVNLGTGREIKIKDLVVLIASLMGYSGKIVFDASKPDGQPRRCLDITKAQKEFGFVAKTDFTAGLSKTIEWFKNDIRCSI